MQTYPKGTFRTHFLVNSRAKAGGTGTEAWAMSSANTSISSDSNSWERILTKQMAPHKHV